jgi:tetratricopeptide (TPR) repeat protein
VPGLTDLVPLLFKGTNLIIAILALVIGGLITWYILASQTQRKKVKVLIFIWLVIILLAGFAMWVCNYIVTWKASFPKDKTGVLVLRIAGDDDNSLQRNLVSSLKHELMLVGGLATNISVRASDELLDDAKLDVSVAHQRARGIGQQLNAQIVVWGNCAGGKKFWPWITIVKSNAVSDLPGERQLNFQVIDQTQPLPELLVNEPVYLAFFLVGFSSYNSGQYVEALNAFESALKHVEPDSPDIALLEFYTANCHYDLAQRHDQPKKLLQTAIEEYKFVLESFGKTKSLAWAQIQNNLGITLSAQAGRSEGADTVRLLGEAITAYRTALEVRMREQFPQDWALIQNNLGVALSTQARRSEGGDAVRLLGEAVTAYRAALEVYTREQFPQRWGGIQNNLGAALCVQAGQSQGADAVRLLGEAVTAFRAALKVYTREQFPQNWAQIQSNLGGALSYQAGRSEGADAVRLLGEAVTAYRAALEVCTREQFPQDWAHIQNNLGSTLCVQSELSQGADALRLLSEAVRAHRAALEVYTREQFPQDWAMTQDKLGTALSDQARRNDGADAVRLLGEAVTAYRAALEVRTREQFPQDWAMTQNNLGAALDAPAGRSQGADAVRLLSEAITAYRAALEIWTANEFPFYHDLATKNLTNAEEALRQLQMK